MLHKESLQLQDQASVYASQTKRAEERLDSAEAALAALRREAAESAGTMAEVLPGLFIYLQVMLLHCQQVPLAR